MGALQACVLIAVMVSTPSLFLVACLLWQSPLIGLDEDSSSASTGDLSSARTSPQARDC
jgi:hypothetical protein